MSALVACLVTGNIERLAFVASSSDSLTGLLVNKVLTTSLAGPGEDNLLIVIGVRVVGNNRGVLLVGLDNGSPSLAAGDDFGLGALGRVTGALGATGVLAVGAFLGGGEGRTALVAGSSDAHADWLIHTENSVVGGSGLQLGELDVEAVTLTQLLGALLEQLAASELGHTLHGLVLGAGFFSFGLRGGFAGSKLVIKNRYWV